MKIVDVTEEKIIFDDDSCIEFYHKRECCEWNYADFSQIESLAMSTDFVSPIEFEVVEFYGFRFGNKPLKMFFIPCYTEQNGCYGYDLEIFYKDKNGNILNKLTTECNDEKNWWAKEAEEMNTKCFLEEVEKVCKKWNRSIAHEDFQGAFLIEEYKEDNIEWLKNAKIVVTDQPPLN